MADEICSEANNTIKFIWIEFLNPGDGITFHHVAVKCKKKFQWENLLTKAAAELNYEHNEIGFPVPDLELDDSVVIWEKNLPDIQLIRGNYKRSGPNGGFYGNIGYPNFTSEPAVKSWIHDPKVVINKGNGPEIEYPHVYIVSGHGGVGRVFGDYGNKPKNLRSSKNATNLGATSLSLIEFESLRVLIIPACTQAAYCRGEDWKQLMKKTNCFAVLGFDGKYTGSYYGAGVMETFLKMLESGISILNAWRSATGAESNWGAFFLDGSTEFTAVDILSPRKKVSKDGSLLHYSKDHNAVPYKTPSITAVHNLLRSSSDLSQEAKEFLSKDFQNIIIDIDKNKRTYLERSETVLWIKQTDGLKFKPGSKLYFRYFLFRPDHPDDFALDKVFVIPEGKVWIAQDSSAELRVEDALRDDVVCCTIKSEVSWLRFQLEFKSDSLKYLKETMEIRDPSLSMACALNPANPSVLKSGSYWCSDKVIDLRILSLQFKG